MDPPVELRGAVDAFRRHAFAALLLHCEAPPIATVAAAASRDAVGVAHAVAWLDAHGALERDGDRLVGAHGLTHRTTRHRLTIGDRSWHTWCAFDAVAIPVALGVSARASTDCPTCAAPLVVDIRDGHLPAGDALLWLPCGPCDDVIADFCAHANLFCRPDHLSAWRDRAGNPTGGPVRFGEVPAPARASWADVARLLQRP